VGLGLPGFGDLIRAPLRAAGAGLDLAVTTAAAAAGLAVESVGGPPARRTAVNRSRHWIEVRGLRGPDAGRIGKQVIADLQALPGVVEAVLNHSTSRAVITVTPGGPGRRDLAAAITGAERRAGAPRHPGGASPGHRPPTLPGDDVLLAARMWAASASAAGLVLATAGTALRLPGLPNLISVLPTLADQLPAARQRLVDRLGDEGTDALLATLQAAAGVLTVSPLAAAAETTTRVLLADEAWALRRSWQHHEPELDAESPPGRRATARARPVADGPGERYANRAGRIGLGAAGLLGILSRDPGVAATAALTAAPRAARATREAFGCAMTRGLTSAHDAVVIRPAALRALDRVDVIVIDPRALYTGELAVTRVRGVADSGRNAAWQAAHEALGGGLIGAGWHRLSAIPGAGRTAGEVLVSPIRDPLATAVVSAARRTGARVVSIHDDGLRSLGQGFDELRPAGTSSDAALAAAVGAFAGEGATVALIASAQLRVHHDAAVTVALNAAGETPWGADVFVPDLAAVWRILRAVPAARDADLRGIRLSLSGSAIGALMLIPGVPGYGPDAVNSSVFAGLWTGFRTGRGVFGEPLPAAEPDREWHGLTAAEVRRLLPRPRSTGEDGREPSPRLAPARLARRTGAAAWSLAAGLAGEIRGDLDDPITPILTTGAVASALLGSPLDAALVAGVLLTNTGLAAQQQLHADRTLRRLLAVQDPPARLRVGPLADRVDRDVAAAALRPGDVIELRAGEVVPADARILEADNVEVDESRLTGESLPVAKQTEPTPGAPLAERSCMVYAGCTVVAGTCLAVVTAVGRGTEVSRAMAMAPGTSGDIGLNHQLARVTGRALPWSLGGGALVGLLSTLRGTPLRDAVASAVAVSVAAVPEGLPLVATLAQLAAARKLSDRHVLIRNSNSVEAMARLDVVCFDKTGTLSQNRLEVKRVRAVRGRRRLDVVQAAACTVVAHDGRADHATDEAVRKAAAELGIAVDGRDAYLPFQSGRPFAASLHGRRLTIKGAPEVIGAALAKGSPSLAPGMEQLAAEGFRVLAVAERTLTARQAATAASDPAAMERLCRGALRPIGLIGLADSPRPTAAALLAGLGRRGIGVRLITGDHPVTAAVVAGELGLEVTAGQVVTGTQWEAMSADERAGAVARGRVFARMSPEHKVEVVQALEDAGLVTAMVGDGANDAAAIRAASVGIGVAAPDSDPARTAADVLLLDGHIEALLDALGEGEQLWRRVQSAVSVLLGGNVGEVSFALLTAMLTGRSVLNARQMLLINMLTDALPAAALAVSDQSGAGTLAYDEAAMWRAIAVRGAATTSGAGLAWLLGSVTGTSRRAATIALIGLVSTQLAQTLADSRSPLVVSTAAGSFLALAAVISTPGLSQLFGCTPVGPVGWGQAFLATGAASILGAYVPGLLETVLGSVVDDDDAGQHQDRVDLAEGRGQKPGRPVDKGVRTHQAGEIGHTTRQARRDKPRAMQK
jgi:cation-transporting P-type ATPase I